MNQKNNADVRIHNTLKVLCNYVRMNEPQKFKLSHSSHLQALIHLHTERTLPYRQLSLPSVTCELRDTESEGTAFWDRGVATFVSLPNTDPELPV